MSAGNYKIWCEQGATFNLSFVWKDSAGTPINLTGCTARMQVRESKSSPETVLSLTSQYGEIVLGGLTGEVDITVTAARTAILPTGQFVYDLEIVNGSVVTRLLEGFFIIDGEVTK